MRPYELLIGLRYTRAKRHNHFISFITLISIAGIMLGMTTLIVVLSVMNGFHEEIRTRTLGVVSHIQLSGADNVLDNWKQLAAEVAGHPQVVASAPFIGAQGLLSFEGVVRGAGLRGVLPDFEAGVTEIADRMTSGSLQQLKAGEFNIVLGAELARALRANLGDKVVLIAPQGQVTPAGILPRLKQFTVAGIFEIGHFEYDANLALIHLDDAQKLYRMVNEVSGLRLKLRDLFQAPQVARELQRTISVDAYAGDWTRQNANLFRAIQIEKRMMFIVLILISTVAAFNIASTLVMAVTDKESDIAILRTLGASPASIMKIFMVQGALIGVFGTLLGVIGGVLLALNVDTVVGFIERLFHVQFLSKEVYYISELPSDLQWADVGVIAAVTLTLSLLATIYPSYRASRVNPAEALRYE
ncbi:MAG: lipoprotein-releasing ABC transporter permease subunit [Burkholderiales bacterium]|nr:lipoprotein-releasing ABC transporter permease subunit [Burkholderiales bacterium]